MISPTAFEPIGFGVTKNGTAVNPKIKSAVDSKPNFLSPDLRKARERNTKAIPPKIEKAIEKRVCQVHVLSGNKPTPIRADASNTRNTVPIYPKLPFTKLLFLNPNPKSIPRIPAVTSPKLNIKEAAPYVPHRESEPGVPPISER